MSAVVIFNEGDRIAMFTDGARYDAFGVLHAVQQKVFILAHANCAISVRGSQDYAPRLFAKLNEFATDFGDVVMAIGGFAMQVHDPEDDIGLGSDVEVFLAGWSNDRAAAEAYVICSHDRYGPAWVPLELGNFAAAPWEGSPPDYRDGDVISAGVSAMETQRAIKADHLGRGEPFHGVGGLCQATIIGPERISTAVVKRWPDVVGEVLGRAP